LTASTVLPSDFRVVIFDYDGTLFDTRPAIVHCLRRSFEKCGRQIPAADVVADAVRSGAALPDAMLQLDGRLTRNPTALNELVVTYRKLYRDEGAALVRAFPGVPDTLRRLRHGGTKCVVVSNKGIEAVQRSFDEAGLSPLIDLMVGDQPGNPKKPDPAIVSNLIVPRYAVRKEEMLIVGDTEVDILFGKRTGIASCWACYGYGDAQRCRALEPEHVISSITELPAVVLVAHKERPDRLGV
jgi:phosphoglycolate phosphatase